uniref:Uncharacterized protein n=1 Tax=Arundo donax TaxID=35708 RepID=A0A0A8YKQ1_ARUDO
MFSVFTAKRKPTKDSSNAFSCLPTSMLVNSKIISQEAMTKCKLKNQVVLVRSHQADVF